MLFGDCKKGDSLVAISLFSWGILELLDFLGFLELLDILDFLELLDFLDFLEILDILDFLEALPYQKRTNSISKVSME